MSHVTNVVLSFSVGEPEGEDDRDVIGRVNKFFSDGGGFVLPADHDWYGGSKFLERPTYVAAFNYLSLGHFIEHLKSLPWRFPEYVQLFVCEQDDDEYRLIYPCKK